MKKSILLLLLVSFNLISYSQNPIWVVAPNYVLTSNPIALPTGGGAPNDPLDPYDYYDGWSARHGSNGMASITGSLRFFVIDGVIYGNNGAYKDYAWSDVQPSVQSIGSENIPMGDGGSEQLIIPHPTLCNHYYIFGVITYWSGDSGNLLPEDTTVNALSLPGFTSSVPAYALYDAANGVW